jgi:U5 small nuclear ribonucleoprotein component
MEDYDEFGNYIGGDLDSDDDNDDVGVQQRPASAFVPQQPAPTTAHAPLEGYDEGVPEESAMEVDGTRNARPHFASFELITTHRH